MTRDYRPHLWLIVGLLLWILADVQRPEHADTAGWGHPTYTALGCLAMLCSFVLVCFAPAKPEPTEQPVTRVVIGEIVH